jgi:hypothetical protein
MSNPRASRAARVGPIAAAACALVLATVPGCRPETAARQETQTMPTRPIETVLADHTPRLMSLPGVIGTYQGALESGRPCIVVLLLHGHADTRKSIPRELEGHPVIVEETDPIRPLGGGD